MAKKASESKDAMVRVSTAFAEALKDVVRIEGKSIAEFADDYLLPIVRKRYKDSLMKEARRVSGEDK